MAELAAGGMEVVKMQCCTRCGRLHVRREHQVGDCPACIKERGPYVMAPRPEKVQIGKGTASDPDWWTPERKKQWSYDTIQRIREKRALEYLRGVTRDSE